MANLQTVAPGETNLLRIVNCLRQLVGYVQALGNSGDIQFNVTEYGAKGDGSTDDAAAIQRAITAAQALGKPAAVYLPPGTYNCASVPSGNPSGIALQLGRTNTANASVLIYGDGPSACTIQAGGALAELLRIGPNIGSTVRLSTSSVRGIRLNGNSHCSAAVMHFYNCIYGRFSDLRIENGSAIGIQGDGNPNTTSTSGDPFTQGCLLDKISVRNCASYGHYYRGVKGSLFSELEADGNTNHNFYWDLENQTSGSNEITENNITGCESKNGGAAGFAFSGAAKHNLSGCQAFICSGAGVQFQPTISGTSAPSTAFNISGLIVRNCVGCIATLDGSGINGLTASNINYITFTGTPAVGIDIKGWTRFTVNNVVFTGGSGNGILIEDDPSPPSGGSAQSNAGIISNIVLIGSGQTAAQSGIAFTGSPSDIKVDNVYSNAYGGSAGYEINISSGTVAKVQFGNLTLIPNTAAHEFATSSTSIVFGGVNRFNTQVPSIWVPRGSPASNSITGQLFEDSGNGNKLTWLDSAGTKHVITTVP